MELWYRYERKAINKYNSGEGGEHRGGRRAETGNRTSEYKDMASYEDEKKGKK